METFSYVVALLALLTFVVGMFSPKTVKCKSRGTVSLIYLGLFLIFIFVGGAFSEETETDTSTENSTSTISKSLSKDEFIASCKEYTYKEIARNPNNYKGNNAYFKGKVIQVQESGNDVVLRVDVTCGEYDWWEDTMYILYERSGKNESRILEEDIIQMYGTLDGIETYRAIFGNDISIPRMLAKYIEVVNLNIY